MGGALGLRAARCEPFGRGLSGAAREQPATVGVGPARTVGGVLWGPRGTRTANGRGVRPPGSGTRLEPSSADRPHLGWLYAKEKRFVGIRDIGEFEDRAACFDKAGRGVRTIYPRWGPRVCVRPHRQEEWQALG